MESYDKDEMSEIIERKINIRKNYGHTTTTTVNNNRKISNTIYVRLNANYDAELARKKNEYASLFEEKLEDWKFTDN